MYLSVYCYHISHIYTYIYSRNCNFINNGYGVQLYDFAEIQIKNSNFVENTIYGVALVTTTPVCNINYCNAWGNGEEPWAENCPG